MRGLARKPSLRLILQGVQARHLAWAVEGFGAPPQRLGKALQEQP